MSSGEKSNRTKTESFKDSLQKTGYTNCLETHKIQKKPYNCTLQDEDVLTLSFKKKMSH